VGRTNALLMRSLIMKKLVGAIAIAAAVLSGCASVSGVGAPTAPPPSIDSFDATSSYHPSTCTDSTDPTCSNYDPSTCTDSTDPTCSNYDPSTCTDSTDPTCSNYDPSTGDTSGTAIPAAPPGDGTYTNSDGNQVPDPIAADTPPAGATAQCNDGTYSFSQHHSGTCSHHGGVATWL
jgi:hypothetical protein